MDPDMLPEFQEWILATSKIVNTEGHEVHVPEEEIQLAESKLKLTFPLPLRELHKLVGNHRRLLESDMRFLRVDEIHREGRALVFCHEKLDRMRWAFDTRTLGEPEPDVQEKYTNERGGWFHSCRSPFSFLLHHLCWQGVMAMDFIGYAREKKGHLEKLQSLLTEPSCRSLRLGTALFSFMSREESILVTMLRDCEYYVGTRDAETMARFESRLGWKLKPYAAPKREGSGSASGRAAAVLPPPDAPLPTQVTPLMQSEFQEWLGAISHVVNPEAADLGVPEGEVQLAESRLQVTLPPALREFYFQVGNHRRLMESHHLFLKVDDLYIEDRFLVFCHENQNVVRWAIDTRTAANDPDPLVLVNPMMQGGTWEPTSSRLYRFLLDNLCWQGVMAMNCIARADLEDGQLEKIQAYFSEPKQLPPGIEMFSFIRIEDSILVTMLDDVEYYVGARNRRAMKQLESRLGWEMEQL